MIRNGFLLIILLFTISFNIFALTQKEQEFFNAINDNISDPVAILGSINSPDTQQTSDNNSAYTAGQTPISGETSVETMGLAVFSHDKLVGELNGLESICHLIISSKLENAQIRIPSPIEQLDYIDLYIELDKNTKNSLYLVNSSPYITSNIKLTAIIQSLNSDIDLDDEKVVDRIEDYAEKYLKYNNSTIKEQFKSYFLNIPALYIFSV